MLLRRLLSSLFVAAGLGMVAILGVSAEGASPTPSSATMQSPPVTVQIKDVSGKDVGSATFTGNPDNTVTVQVQVQGLTPGEHGIHIHQNGVCDPSGSEPFASAGEHFNPTNKEHGAPIALTPEASPPAGQSVASPETANVMPGSATPAATTPHAGDLGNITVDASGSGTLSITVGQFTLMSGEATSLQTATGTSIVIHSAKDDLTTQPSGNRDGRIACGVIFGPTGSATPAASPAQ